MLLCAEGWSCERALLPGEGDGRQHAPCAAGSRYLGSVGYASRSTQPAQSWGTAENGEIPDRAWHSCARPVIQLFLDLCQTCQETRGRKSTHKIIHKPIIPDTVGQRGQADLVDLQMVPDGGYKYILNYQDCFSKFVILRALKTKTAAEVADCLVNIFFEHGPPSLLQTDNGAEFSNKLLMARIKQLWTDTVIVHGRPRHPQDQGSVERANGDFKNMILSSQMSLSMHSW